MKKLLFSLLIITFLTSQSSYEDSWKQCSSCEKKQEKQNQADKNLSTIKK